MKSYGIKILFCQNGVQSVSTSRYRLIDRNLSVLNIRTRCLEYIYSNKKSGDSSRYHSDGSLISDGLSDVKQQFEKYDIFRKQ